MTDRETWLQLIQAPGWLLLKERAKAYWTDQIDQHLATAANDRDDVVALNRMRQVLASKQAVESLLKLPEEELRRLDMTEDRRRQVAETFSRGGL